MKIIKRDGRIVEYNRDKIKSAIERANKDVQDNERVNNKQIENIIKHIEDLNKKRMLVEDIQDIIETELMHIKKYNLAKAYIIYRYNRALVRKSNITDESILSLIKNKNRNLANENDQNIIEASIQRDLIASEVSKDLTKRILLPEKISTAHEKGQIFFHDSEYFLQSIIDSCYVNYNNILNNQEPNNFILACSSLINLFSIIKNSQYGNQTFDLSHLGKYLYQSENNIINKLNHFDIENEIINSLKKEYLDYELENGIKLLNSFLNNNQKIILYINLEENKYINYNLKIVETLLNQIYVEKNNLNYNIVYVLNEQNILNDQKYDYITELILKLIEKKINITLISSKIMKDNFDNNVFAPIGNNVLLPLYKNNNVYEFEGRFSQGTVTLNLVQIALDSSKQEEIFWKILDERMEICYEALMSRYYALLGTISDISPIHWQNGVLAKLNKNEKIDKLLKNNYSTLSLGYLGIYEMTKYMKDATYLDLEGEKFITKVLKYMRKKCDIWQKETGVSFILTGTINEEIQKYFIEIDRDNYGEIKDITDKEKYSDSFTYPEKINYYDKLIIEGKLQLLSINGSMCKLSLTKNQIKNTRELLNNIYNYSLQTKINMEEENE